jgi:hypothetical protein
MNAHPPELNPVARKPGKPLNIVCLRRPQHADTVVAQIAFIIESSGIPVIARRMQLRANAQPRAIGQSQWSDGRLARPACSLKEALVGSIVAGRGRPALHLLGILYFLVNRQAHSSLHGPSFALARDLFRLHINRFANRPRPRSLRISLANHTRSDYNLTAIRQSKDASVILLKFVRPLTANLNQKGAQKNPRSQRERFG